MLKYVFLAIILIFSLIILFFTLKSKRPIFTMFFNALIGLLVLCIIDFTAALSGVYIPINQYTVAGSAVFGIPAVILFLVLKLIFI